MCKYGFIARRYSSLVKEIHIPSDVVEYKNQQILYNRFQLKIDHFLFKESWKPDKRFLICLYKISS